MGGPCNPPQFCCDDSYEYSGGVVPNVTCFGSVRKWAQQSRGSVVAFKDAFQAFSSAAKKLAKMKFSIKCNKDLAAVGTNSAAVQADAANLTDNITQKLVKDCF